MENIVVQAHQRPQVREENNEVGFFLHDLFLSQDFLKLKCYSFL